MGAGRPTKYKKARCQEAAKWLSEGFSKEATSGLMDITPSTFYLWEEKHPEFSEAVEKGFVKGQASFEKLLIAKTRGQRIVINESDVSGKVSENSLHFMLTRRYKKNFGNEQKIDHTVSNPTILFKRKEKDESADGN